MRSKLLHFFTREHMFYNIKEVEAQGSKFTGVHSMQIKELLQSLVDDGLVNAEKCGITTLYWCFEYDKHKKMKVMVEKSQKKNEDLSKEIQRLTKTIKSEEAKRTKGNGGEMMQKITNLNKEKSALQEKMSSSAFDVDRVECIKKELQNEISNGEIYTDNIESLIYYFNKNNGIGREMFKHELGIPEEFKDFPNLDERFSKFV